MHFVAHEARTLVDEMHTAAKPILEVNLVAFGYGDTIRHTH